MTFEQSMRHDELVLSHFEEGGQVIEVIDSMTDDDLPRYSVRSLILGKLRFELFETLADAEVYEQELKTIIQAVIRTKLNKGA